MNSSPQIEEARVFGRYLLRSEPSEAAVRLYCDALAKRPVASGTRDEKITRFVLRNPRFLPAIDGALAFSKKRSALRDKLLLMTAVLETQPEHASLFLPQQRPAGYWFIAGLRLCGAVFRLLSGKILLGFI